jgi:hypothetical protein
MEVLEQLTPPVLLGLVSLSTLNHIAGGPGLGTVSRGA